MQQLTGQDASFFYMETPRTPMHIGGIMIYDPSTTKSGKQGFKDILRAVDFSNPRKNPLPARPAPIVSFVDPCHNNWWPSRIRNGRRACDGGSVASRPLVDGGDGRCG